MTPVTDPSNTIEAPVDNGAPVRSAGRACLSVFDCKKAITAITDNSATTFFFTFAGFDGGQGFY